MSAQSVNGKLNDQDLLPLIDQGLTPTQMARKLKAPLSTIKYRLRKIKKRGQPFDRSLPLELSSETEEVNKKTTLTIQEATFLDLHFIDRMTIKEAMVKAGYADMGERNLYFKAQKIIQKYEVRAEDHRHIMRAVGAGEARVITHLWHLAQKAGSDTAKVAATTTLGKWLGMDKDQQQGGTAVQIVLQAAQGSAQQINVGGPAPTLPAEAGQAQGVTVTFQHPGGEPGKPVQITR